MRGLAIKLTVVSLMCAAVVPAEAAPVRGPGASRRTIVEEYAAPAAGASLGPEGYAFVPFCADRIGCVPIFPEPGDRYMRVTVKDAVTSNPQFWLRLWPSGGGYEYCGGGSSDVVPIMGETEIWVLLPQGLCVDGSATAATHGEVVIEFARTRKALLEADGTAAR